MTVLIAATAGMSCCLTLVVFRACILAIAVQQALMWPLRHSVYVVLASRWQIFKRLLFLTGYFTTGTGGSLSSSGLIIHNLQSRQGPKNLLEASAASLATGQCVPELLLVMHALRCGFCRQDCPAEANVAESVAKAGRVQVDFLGVTKGDYKAMGRGAYLMRLFYAGCVSPLLWGFISVWQSRHPVICNEFCFHLPDSEISTPVHGTISCSFALKIKTCSW